MVLDHFGSTTYSGVEQGGSEVGTTIVRDADAKGRITLGKRFANRSVIIEDIDETTVKISLARVIPERDMWLWENQVARAAVLRGLEQARRAEFSEPPDLDADERLADQIEE